MTTRSRFSLRVPVLSKHTTSTRPSASTDRGVRTSAPDLVSLRAAACCASVATSGRPSGTAATATATPLVTACRSPVPRRNPTAVTSAPPPTLTGSTRSVRLLSCACRPTCDALAGVRAPARPASVASPTAVTIAAAVPVRIVVPANTMQARSLSGAPGVGDVCLLTGSDSPVSEDSSTSTPDASTSLPSAGTTSPGPISITSPGRNRDASTRSVTRRSGGPATRCAGGSPAASNRFSRRSACRRCTADSAALPASTDPTSTASIGDPSRALAADPVARTGVSGSDSSVRIARPKSQANPTGHAVSRPIASTGVSTRFTDRRRETAASSSLRAGSSRRTSGTGISCQA